MTLKEVIHQCTLQLHHSVLLSQQDTNGFLSFEHGELDFHRLKHFYLITIFVPHFIVCTHVVTMIMVVIIYCLCSIQLGVSASA